MAASRADKIEIFKLFLAEERVDVNLVSPKDNISVLMCSLWNFNEEAARLLLKEPRVNVNWMNSKGMSALHVVAAAEKNHVKMFELLLSHPRVDVNCNQSPIFTTVLHVAAAKNNPEVVKLILDDPRFTSANALTGQVIVIITVIIIFIAIIIAISVIIVIINVLP